MLLTVNPELMCQTSAGVGAIEQTAVDQGLTCVQITREELETAMSFLGDQLGEEELRMLLDKLNAFGEAKDCPINVSNLMALAAPGSKSDVDSNSDAAKTRDTLAGLSHKV